MQVNFFGNVNENRTVNINTYIPNIETLTKIKILCIVILTPNRGQYSTERQRSQSYFYSNQFSDLLVKVNFWAQDGAGTVSFI